MAPMRHSHVKPSHHHPKQDAKVKHAPSLPPSRPPASASPSIPTMPNVRGAALLPVGANISLAYSKSKHSPAASCSQAQKQLLSHDIFIDEEEHNDTSSDPPPTTCCCGRSLSLSWEHSQWAIRITLRKPRTTQRRTMVISDATKVTTADGSQSLFSDPNLVLDVRIPILHMLLLFAMFASCTFVDLKPLRPVADARDLPPATLSFGRPNGAHSFSKVPLAPQHLYHFHHNLTDERNSSQVAFNQSLPESIPPPIPDTVEESSPDLNAHLHHPPEIMIPLGPRLPASVFLSPPYLTQATTPTGAPGVGLHVPCKWLEERFGKPEQFTELKTIINFVRLGVELPLAPSTAVTDSPPPSASGLLVVLNTTTTTSSAAAASAESFIPTESVEVNQLLGSVGIYCQPDVVRDECEFEGVSKRSSDNSRLGFHNALELARLHAWFSGLPELAKYEEPARISTSTRTPESVSFNMFTGAVATVNCRNQIRYAAPFANDETPSVYIEPNFNILPDNYAQFVSNRCTQEAREKAINAETASADAKVEHEQQQQSRSAIISPNATDTEATVVAAAVPEPPKRAKWIEPLIPLLPPVCSIASFSRPSLARACLRNARIIGFGDSTTQELLLMLIDFLEQDDGEDPSDLTRMRIDTTSHGHKASSESEWMPSDAGSNGQHRYILIEHWTPPDGCYEATRTTFMGRLFSTARFPTPYLAAYNITVTMRWNVGVEACSAARGPNRASDLDMYRASYRWLVESCLPDNAVEIVEKYRRKPDGTLRTAREYIEHVNGLFHNRARDNQHVYAEEPPPFGCKYPYLPVEEFNALSLPEWQLHLASVPNFEYAVMGMGAHMAGFWDKPDAQRGQDGYSYNPEQFHHAFESHLVLVQSFARNVVIRETAWRTDGHGGSDIPLMNVIIREVTIEAQARALRQDMEVEQLMNIARRATIGGTPIGLALAPPRRSVSWLPTFFNTAMLQKEDNDHCSYKSVGGGFGVNGMRTPYCYPIVQKMIEVFCSNK